MKIVIYILLSVIILSNNTAFAHEHPGILNIGSYGVLIFKDKDGKHLGNVEPRKTLKISKDKFPVKFMIKDDCDQKWHKIEKEGCFSINFKRNSLPKNYCTPYGSVNVTNWGCFW